MSGRQFAVDDVVRTAIDSETEFRIVEKLPPSESSRRLGGDFFRLDDGKVFHGSALEFVR